MVEGDSSHVLNSYPPYYLLPDYASAAESGILDGVDKNRKVLLQMAQGITLTETENVISEALLTTSDSAYSKAAGYEMTTIEKEDGDPDGPFTLGGLRPQGGHRGGSSLGKLRQYGQRGHLSGGARQRELSAGLRRHSGRAGEHGSDRIEGAGTLRPSRWPIPPRWGWASSSSSCCRQRCWPWAAW